MEKPPLDVQLKDDEILTEEEKQRLLVEFNNTRTDYPKDRTIADLFEEQVTKTPDNIAVVYHDTQLTYRELNEKANQVAWYLQAHGVKTGDIVGVSLPKSLELVIVTLGILKVGGVNLFIDRNYPEARRNFLLHDSHAQLVLKLEGDDTTVRAETPILAIQFDRLSAYPVENPKRSQTSGSLAYVIYTSGSTGRPKGVMLHHAGINNHIFTKIQITGLTCKDVVCQNLSHNFVASIWQIWAPLYLGGRVVMYDDDLMYDAYDMFQRVQRDRISVLAVVPSLLNAYINLLDEGRKQIDFSHLRVLLLTGERIRPDLINRYYRRYRTVVINAYGQSECSDDTLHYQIPYSTETTCVPIGRPSNNTRIYILNADQQLQPIGAVGEICISGDGLSPGYLHNPRLTAETFIPHPFQTGERLYKTGDLGRWLPDGNIECLGRIDEQVKIRGFRIELGEIEGQLVRHPLIQEAVVVAKELNTQQKELVAYIMTNTKTTLHATALHTYLHEFLPEYMVPSYFVMLEQFPLTPTGKIDKKALPAPDEAPVLVNDEYVAPRDDLEQKLVTIWEEILGRGPIGIHDNFFHVGGQSLNATQIASRIFQELSLEISIREIFAAPTIAALAETARHKTPGLFCHIESVPETQDYYDVSHVQRQFWVVEQIDTEHIAYNIPISFVLQGRLDIVSFQKAFDTLIMRHESLRTSFTAIEGVPKQIIHPSITFSITEIDLSDSSTPEAVARHYVEQDALMPFDLTQTPLFRVHLLKIGNDKYIFMLTIHHILCDGWSLDVLLNELGTLYHAYCHRQSDPLSPLRIQYKDYAVWQNQLMASPQAKALREYWHTRFAGELPVLNLPADYPRPAIKTTHGDTLQFTLDETLTADLNRLSKTQGSTLFMTLLACVKVLLYRYTGQEDITIGTPIAGRSHLRLEGQIGCYINNLALRDRIQGEDSFLTVLEHVTHNTMEAYDHQWYPFDALIEELDVARDISSTPLFNVMVILHNYKQSEFQLEDVTISPFIDVCKVSKFDLTFIFTEASKTIQTKIEYNTDLFRFERIQRLWTHFQELVTDVIRSPEKPVKDLNILPEEERHQIFVEFNNTHMDYPKNKTIVDLFEEQVVKTPDNIAVVYENRQLCYKDLNERANQLAHYLRKYQHIQPDDLVGIMVNRNEWMVIAVLGILKAGGAYVPIDPEYPVKRIKYMLEESKCTSLLTEHALAERARTISIAPVINIQDALTEETTNPLSPAKPYHLAYVIYTSGSTGKPKGVMVEHRGLVNLSESLRRRWNLDTFDVRLLQIVSISFDVFLEDFCRALLYGGQMIIAPSDIRLAPDSLYELLQKYQVNICEATPLLIIPLLNYIQENNLPYSSLKFIILGGDTCLREDFTGLLSYFGNSIHIINSYGTTETTIDSSHYEATIDNLSPGSTVPIGKPLDNIQYYILDVNHSPQPIGIPGELYIGGVGLARGYLHNEELTKQRFIPNPFKAGERLYKTGDLGRWLSNGNIECLGRTERQVKLRGFRIELGEIEGVLAAHPCVCETVVMVREDCPGDKHLVAYITPDINAEDLQTQMRELHSNQITLWHAMYEEIYTCSSVQDDITFNTASWDSTYTGEPIPEEEMREFVDATVGQILALHPRRVLEIGCGTGLLLSRIAPYCEQYWGTDFSQAALQHIIKIQGAVDNLDHVVLFQRMADNFDDIESGAFDTVILNSVVQSFPSIDYLLYVLEGAINSLKPGGAIFIGDIRSLPFLKAYHASVQLYKAPPILSRAQLEQIIQQQMVNEEELLIDPAFFYALKQQFPRITHVNIELKRGYHHNELTRFRYDVILYIDRDNDTASIEKISWLDWKSGRFSVQRIQEILVNSQPEALGLRSVSNARLQTEVHTLKWLDTARASDTVEQLREELLELSQNSVDPEKLRSISYDLPYTVTISWSDSGQDGQYDVIFTRCDITETDGLSPCVFPLEERHEVKPWKFYANNPLQGRFHRKFVPQLRNLLKERLPHYMVPSAFVILGAMPLTLNGKIDRRALPTPNISRRNSQEAYVGPRTPTEATLTRIWCDVLSLEKVGTYDDFFELGGQSLLALQAISRIRQTFDIELPLRDIFEKSTIASLAGCIYNRH